MTERMIRPLGNRVLIKPHPKRTESAGGLAIVEDWQPDTGGVVVALGDGIESRKKAVQRFAAGVLEELADGFNVLASGNTEAADFAVDVIGRRALGYQPEHVCAVGDEVTFGVSAGTELDIAGELYLLVNEDDLETISEPVEATA